MPPSPPSTHRKYPAAMYHFCGILFVSVERRHCVYMGASAATNTTGRQLHQIKIPWQWVSCAEQRWWTFIYTAWQYQCQTMNRLKQRPGSAGVGLATEEGGTFGRFSRGAWEINRAAFKKLAWFLVSAGVGGWGEGAACPLPTKHTPQISGCDVQFLWHFVCVHHGATALRVHGSVCGYKHDWAPAASNKDTVAMGFVRGTAMVDFHIHGRVEKNGLGWAWQYYQCQTMNRLKTAAWLGWGRTGLAWPQGGWGIREIPPKAWEINRAAFKNWLGLAWLGYSGAGGLGGRGRLAPSPPSTHRKYPAAMYNFVAFCLCLWSDGTVCTWERLRLRQNKDTVAMGFVRGTAMVDFHIHGRVEKNGLGWAWQYQCQTMNRLKTAAWLGWGRIGSR